jgi:hypothetical protein
VTDIPTCQRCGFRHVTRGVCMEPSRDSTHEDPVSAYRREVIESDLRRDLAAQIEALVEYESADLPPGGTWISRSKVLAILAAPPVAVPGEQQQKRDAVDG